MVVTGPTVIVPLLRQAALNRRTASYLKWEGILNDPIGALLAVLVFQFFLFQGEGSGWGEVAQGLGFAIASSLVLGLLGGWLIGTAFREGLVPEYLKSPVLLGLVLVVYAVSDFIQKEAGLMGPRMVEAGYDAAVLLPLVFAIIFATVFSHGLTINWLAVRLGLASRHRDGVLIVGASPWTVALAETLKSMDITVLLADSSWHNLRPARLSGVPVFYGEILSEFAEESVEIAHIRTMLAATSNDAYNALVCMAIAPEIGRQKTLQLSMGGGAEEDPKSLSRPRRGDVAFTDDADFYFLWRLLVRGWKFSKTRITESYTYEDFLADRDEEDMEILLIDEEGDAEFRSPSRRRDVAAGETILYFGRERQEKANAETAKD
jgi:voltage-gated potassium channel Kch